MKIAKVNRIKTAIGTNKGSKNIGFLYTDPNRKGSSADIEKIVDKRCDATKILYNVFDEGALKENVSSGAKALAKLFNAGIKSLKKGKDGIPERITESLNAAILRDALENANIENKKFSEADIQEAIDSLLKKCFRTPEIKSALRSLMVYLYTDCKQGSSVGQNLGEDREFRKEEDKLFKKYFITRLVADYSKYRVKKFIPKSIQNKAMPVQPRTEGSKSVLVLPTSNTMSTKKKTSKDAINSFLTRYAVLDDNERHNLRLRLRRLVNLYFYGMEDVCTEDFDEWKDHEEKRKISDKFADVVYKDIVKDGKTRTILDTDATYGTFRRKNIERYRYCIDMCNEAENNASLSDLFFCDSAMNSYWIRHIEDEVEKLYSNFHINTEEFRFSTGYISEKTWKGIINFLSVKYISIGKVVYNFILDGISSSGNIPDPGKIKKEMFTSFDYEDIKAEETLQREIAVNIAFAANHLASATMDTAKIHSETGNADEETDMLTFSKEQIGKYAKEGIIRNIMQHFGGLSRWNGFNFNSFFEADADFLYGIKSIVYSLRNSSFHFRTDVKDAGKWDRNLIAEMFRYDCRNLSDVRKGKIYSNNLPMFYSELKLGKVMDRLYDRQYERASQVPAFNTVFTRSKFAEELREYGINPVFADVETKNIWLNALYFLYKETYYNGFIQDSLSLKRFISFADKLPVEYDNKNRVTTDSKPSDDFKKAVNEYGRYSGTLAEMCQYIMTEYNRQNLGDRKKKSDYATSKKPLIYQHYKMLLLKGLRDSFMAYLKDNADLFGFTESPSLTALSMPELKDFLSDHVSNEADDIIRKAEKDPDLLKWYVTARLLNPKQVNQLAGSFRAYKQYVADIRRRASETGNLMSVKENGEQINNILKVLEIVTVLSGATSNVLEDYFDDKDDYARYLSRFVDFGLTDGEGFPSAVLGNFCQEEAGGHRIGIFHDGENPILNRNVIMCKLYGAGDIINQALERLTKEDIADYYRLDDAIKAYREKGECTDAKQQAQLKEFQEMKNRTELRNIVEYSELLNEFQGQLVNWAYLRERDLMYFQLGLHYLCFNNKTPKPEGYRVIRTGDREISGAVLYQIVAMYTCGLPLYYKDSNGDYTSQQYNKKAILPGTDNALISIGAKVPYFLRYSEIIKKLGNDRDTDEIYLAGMELFENVAEHDDCIELRKYIEHFKYFSKTNCRSILDIYSEVFDRFFSYDSKYRKNVVNMAYNILLSHCVVTAFSFGTGEKFIHLNKKSTETKARATVSLRAKNGLSSDKYTYKIKQDDKTTKEIKLCARGKCFLGDVAKLICFPDLPPENVVRDPAEEDENALMKFNFTDGNDREKSEEGKQTSGSGNGKKQYGKKPRYDRNEKKTGQKDKDRQDYRQDNVSIGTSLADKINKLNWK